MSLGVICVPVCHVTYDVEAGAEVELSDGRRLRCKAVVAADGAKSWVAAKLGLKPAAYAGEVYYR